MNLLMLTEVVSMVVAMIMIIASEPFSVGAALVTDDLLAPLAKLLVGAAIIYSATSSSPAQDNLLDFVSKVLNVLMVIILPLFLWYVFSNNQEEEVMMIGSSSLLMRFLLFLQDVAVSEYNNIRFSEHSYVREYKIFSGYMTWGVIFGIAFSSIFELDVLGGSLIALSYAVLGVVLSTMDIPQKLEKKKE